MKNPNMPPMPLRKPLVNLNNSRANGSPMRRSISIAPAPIAKDANNDEAERIQRRNNLEIQRISSIGLNRSMTGDNSELSVTKMQDHFEQCVRLFAENKINAKNAWNLQIIEYMRRLLDKDQFEMGDSLQIASTSLDIGSKVYGLRVDDIHNEIMKLASNMARINLEVEESVDNHGEDSESDNEGAAAQQKKKERRKKRSSGGDENSQLVTNMDTITGHLPTATFYNRQENASQRLYTLSALQTLKSGDEQLVSGRSKLRYWCSLTESINVRPVSGLVAVTIPPANGTICPSFTDFSVDEWDPEADLDISHATPHGGEEVVYDEDGFPVPELDRSLNHFDEDQLYDVEEEFAGEAQHAEAVEVAHITDMRPGSVNGRLEYSYREAPVISERYMLTGVWAGPAHWKVKCLQRTATATIVKGARVVRRRVPRAPPVAVSFDLTADELKGLTKGQRSRFVKTIHDEYSRITYPEDMRITRSDICALFLRPDVYVSYPEQREDVPGLDHNITNYEYDNPNDAEYCNETLHGDALDSDAEAGADGDESCFMDDNMVNAPNLVQKSHVAYATQAKKVDMKKLKKAIIRTVARLDAHNSEMNDDDELENCKISKVSFCKMYEALPNEINSRMADEVSCPLAYVALLHLCNERNLQLDGQEDLLDVLISSN